VTDSNAMIDDLIADLTVQTQQNAALVEELKAAWAAHEDDCDGSTDAPVDSSYLDVSSTVSVGSIDSSYSGYGATIAVNDANSVTLEGNSWAAVPLPQTYTVTADTLLDIDVFAETDEAEIVGFALWNPDTESREGFDVMADRGFQVMGTQKCADEGGPWYVGNAGVGTLHSFTDIPLSATTPPGDYTHLMFVRDYDVSQPNGRVTFSNIQLREETSGGGGQEPDTDPGAAVASAPYFGGRNGGTYTHPHDITTASGDTYVATQVDNPGETRIVHMVSSDGNFDSPQTINSHGSRDGHLYPAMLQLNSGRIIVVNGGHVDSGDPQLLQQQTSDGGPTGPWSNRDISGEFSPSGDNARDWTYTNLFQHTGESGEPVYLISRMKTDTYEWGPWIAKSTDDAETWNTATRLTINSNDRPYWVAAPNGTDKTWLFFNENNWRVSGSMGIYAAYWQNDRLHLPDGTVVSLPMEPQTDLDVVVGSGDPGGGRVWPQDAAIDDQGRPVVTWAKGFTGKLQSGDPVELWWARLEGGVWNVQMVDSVTYEFSVSTVGAMIDRLDTTKVYYGDEVNGADSEEAFVNQTDGSSFGTRTQLTDFYATHGGINGMRLYTTRVSGPRLELRCRKNPDGTFAQGAGSTDDDTIFAIDPDGGLVTAWPDGS
jgi:hypothetical protein